MHDMFIQWILSEVCGTFIGVTAFLLMALYVIQIFTPRERYVCSNGFRKNRLIMRALNWGVFGCIFLLFGGIIASKDLLTWRATARVALLFLMLPEFAYQIIITWAVAKEFIWTSIHRS